MVGVWTRDGLAPLLHDRSHRCTKLTRGSEGHVPGPAGLHGAAVGDAPPLALQPGVLPEFAFYRNVLIVCTG